MGWDLNNRQEVIERYIDTNAKAGQQPSLFIKKSNSHWIRGHWPLKSEDSRDQKDSKVKKTYNLPAANQSNSGSRSRSGV